VRIVDGRLRIAASDVANFVACQHLTRLNLAAAHRLVTAPTVKDLGAEVLEERGREHESEILESFRNRGWEVHDPRTGSGDPMQEADATAAAIRSGAKVIYQGTLLVDDRVGLPDFLIRADLLGAPTGPAPYYEVVDAKLARSAKAQAVLQTAFYSELVGEVQQHMPERMHLALGSQDLLPLRVADYAAYTRQVRRLLGAFASEGAAFPPTDTYPEPVEQCAVCRWRLVCDRQRRDDDDLSLIAGITARQRKALKQAGIETRRGFAALDEAPGFERASQQSMTKAHAQARLQVEGEDAKRILWQFIEPEREEGALKPNRGLTALPVPSAGDLFFDIEGARYYSEDGKEYGLQYLFGIVDTADRDSDGRPRYQAIWSFDRSDEKRAFEEIVDFIVERQQQHSDLHVYHYNHYEPTAFDHLSELHETREDVIGRLMGRFATREDQVDELLRGRVFVDLYRVVRQGIRASVESYSIKRLEPLFGFERQVALQDVNERMVRFEIALDDHSAALDRDGQTLIQGYNEDDCRSTLGLRDWLEHRRLDLETALEEDIPRPVPPVKPDIPHDPEVEALRETLLANLPEQDRTAEQKARALMADLLEWHRRDAKPGWWRFFHLKDLTDDELLGEPDAIAGLTLEGIVDTVKQSYVIRYRFPPQEHPFRQGDKGVDPRSDKEWTIHQIDDAAGILDLRRGKTNTSPHPIALIESGPIRTDSHRARLLELAAKVAAQGESDWGHRADLDLLLRRPPSLGQESGASLRLLHEEAVDAGRRLALALEDSHLPIQGPPGSGKTYTAAKQVSDLVSAGKRVGITANSHAVICNLLKEVAEQNELGRPILIAQKPDAGEAFASPHATTYGQLSQLLGAIDAGNAEVIGGTTWLWTHEDFRDSVDVLVVDEASQMSLANVLAAAHAAPNLILLGDPQQLGQPSAGSHPPGAGISALERVLGEKATMPPDRGLFIEQTRRMHPDVCAFISEVFYDNLLDPLKGLSNQTILGEGRLSGTGLRVEDVVHEGNDNSSREEAEEVAELVAELHTRQWRSADGDVAVIGLQGILVVTPFNAQVREIEAALEARGLRGAKVGTVDKFQGQEAPVVIYSMASSTAEDAPRGMEFLYDLRRLNVATSRARCLAILVSSPELVRVFCGTPRQIELANALCRFREIAEPRA
jgi:predicted RecB family nuclease